MNIEKFLRHIPFNPQEMHTLLTMDKLKKNPHEVKDFTPEQ
jgi:hypothetical protein